MEGNGIENTNGSMSAANGTNGFLWPQARQPIRASLIMLIEFSRTAQAQDERCGPLLDQQIFLPFAASLPNKIGNKVSMLDDRFGTVLLDHTLRSLILVDRRSV